MGENGNILIILPPTPLRSWLHLRLYFFYIYSVTSAFRFFECNTLASKTSIYGGDARMKDLLHTFNEWKHDVETKFKRT